MEEEIEELERDMTPILVEDLGMRFPTEESKHKAKYGLYQCQYCGKEFECMLNSVKSGNTKSCGCQSIRYKNPHGLTQHPLYNTWKCMIRRCHNPLNSDYKYYGGRGIQVCEEWKDVRNFVKWVEDISNWEEGLTLDRIDTNGNYSPENCTFSNRTIQSINQRMQSNNTSGFVGVNWVKRESRWKARVNMYGKEKHIGYFKTLEEAVEARDKYIIDNNLPHPLSTDNK